MRGLLILFALIVLFVNDIYAQQPNELPPEDERLGQCEFRTHKVDPPWVNGHLWCLEEVINAPEHGELAFTALATAPDGTLYAASPLTGEIYAFADTDGDLLPDSPQVAANGLTMPNGLAYYHRVLYISGGANLYRLENGDLSLLVDDLPTGSGFGVGGLTIGADERLYVAIGAPCDACEFDNPARGAVLSFALDGTDRQIVAAGLRNPADVAFQAGSLWTLDSARDGLAEQANLDELNRVIEGAHFGWPYCVGADNHADLFVGTFDCARATPPALTFPTRSNPTAITAYTAELFPRLRGSLIVALAGARNQVVLQGFSIVVVHLDADGLPTDYELIIPEQFDKNNPPGLTFQDISYQGSGLWPHHPYDVAVNAEGWVYISVGGGRILAIRPLG